VSRFDELSLRLGLTRPDRAVWTYHGQPLLPGRDRHVPAT
jgi:hypothetical protein